MWQNIIGIDTEGPGFDKILIHPRPGGGLTWAKGTYRSIHGPITVDWKQEGDTLEVRVEIPPNTSATVYLPAKESSDVSEDDKPAEKAEGVTFQGIEDGNAVFMIGSGEYRFTVSK